jgi:hypothetical protein
MRTIMLLLAFFAAFTAWADQPPCWCEFSVRSANKQFVAHVRMVKGPLKPGQNQEWELQVYQKKASRDSTLLWKSHYRYDGYPDGVLSDDGKNFAYVNYWYYSNGSVVEVYQSGRHVASLPGKAFNISPSKIPKSASHQLWLTNEGQAYEFTADKQKNCLLKVTTIDARVHLIDCATGQFKR